MPEAPDYSTWVQQAWTFPSGYGDLKYTFTFHTPPAYKPLADAAYAMVMEAAKLPTFNFFKVVIALSQLLAAFQTGNPAAILAAFQALLAAITGP